LQFVPALWYPERKHAIPARGESIFMTVFVHAVGRPEVPPLRLPDRFRTEVAYFMALPGEGQPHLPPGEYRVDLGDARRWLEEGEVSVVSPLDSAARAQIELREEHEQFLEWLVAHGVEHVRLQAATEP
jgi:hypothetical protein